MAECVCVCVCRGGLERQAVIVSSMVMGVGLGLKGYVDLLVSCLCVGLRKDTTERRQTPICVTRHVLSQNHRERERALACLICRQAVQVHSLETHFHFPGRFFGIFFSHFFGKT